MTANFTKFHFWARLVYDSRIENLRAQNPKPPTKKTGFFKDFYSQKHENWHTCTLGLGVPIYEIGTVLGSLSPKLSATEVY